MSFSDLIKERFSCRKFKNTEVEQEKIDRILNAALVAPTAVNKQPQRILVLNDKQKLSRLNECTKFSFDAPLCFIICYDSATAYNRGYDGKNSAEIDASIVTTHMMLAAASLGIGTTWVMHFDPVAMRKEFEVPANYEPVAVLIMGYPAPDAEPSAMHKERRSVSELVSFDRF